MNDNFNDQNEKLVSLSREINLLRQQVNYLLRNGKPLDLLDLDVLMNRTHTIYDTLCSINLGENNDSEDLEFDPEAIAGLFGVEMDDGQEEVDEPAEEPASEPDVAETPQPETIAENSETPTDEPETITDEPETIADEPELTEATESEVAFEETETFKELVDGQHSVEDEPQIFDFQESVFQEAEPVEPELPDLEPTKEPVEERDPAGDEYGFLFRFEDISRNDDFETERTGTLGDRMIGEDHSLAAKLQQNPIQDLRSEIGINDKFLFVNELFGGSMEKYNKSIDNLNDLKTLNGAMIYLNELKIDLQWNSSNEAYRKLSELIRRKFE